MLSEREIWLRHVKCAAAREDLSDVFNNLEFDEI